MAGGPFKAPVTPTPGEVTPKDVYDALRRAGASTVQAIGIMGNMLAESGLNPESHAMDSNGYQSYGLAQWNSDPQNYGAAARGLVTGHQDADLRAQINFLHSTGGFAAASGSTYQETASNFAAKYERCKGCTAGGAQNTSRVGNAHDIAGWVAQGNWPVTAGVAADQAAINQSQPGGGGNPVNCAWQVGWGGVFGVGGFQACIVSKSELRALIGGGILVLGGLVLLTGAGLLAAMVGVQAAGPLGNLVSAVPGGGAVAGAVKGAAKKAPAAKGATKASVATAA